VHSRFFWSDSTVVLSFHLQQNNAGNAQNYGAPIQLSPAGVLPTCSHYTVLQHMCANVCNLLNAALRATVQLPTCMAVFCFMTKSLALSPPAVDPS